MTGREIADKARDIALNYSTLYVMGCFGAPLTKSNKSRYIGHHMYNQRADRLTAIEQASADTFGFDCVNLIKGILWGWCGKTRATYGGAKYDGGYVGDVDADQLINLCDNVQDCNWEDIQPGCMVWMEDHAGIYVGNGLVAESTPRWDDGVQLTCLANIKSNGAASHSRIWDKWGMLPSIEYDDIPAKDDSLPNIGDIVTFSGGRHYATSMAKLGFKARAGLARVHNVAPNADHPVSLIHIGRDSNVYGWVDIDTITR